MKTRMTSLVLNLSVGNNNSLDHDFSGASVCLLTSFFACISWSTQHTHPYSTYNIVMAEHILEQSHTPFKHYAPRVRLEAPRLTISREALSGTCLGDM